MEYGTAEAVYNITMNIPKMKKLDLTDAFVAKRVLVDSAFRREYGNGFLKIGVQLSSVILLLRSISSARVCRSPKRSSSSD